MPSVSATKRAVRWALFTVPRLYDLVAKERRYLAYARFGIVHEAEFRALAELAGRPDPLVVDVGANVGQSVLSTLTVLPHARVVSFEPNPANWPALDRLRARLGDAFSYHRFGLADREGQARLFQPTYRGRAVSGLASFDRHEAEQGLSASDVYGFRPEALGIEVVDLELRTLDGFGLGPDIIKVDVQGLEDSLIAGGWRTIEACAPGTDDVDPVTVARTPSVRRRLRDARGRRTDAGRDGQTQRQPIVRAHEPRTIADSAVIGGPAEPVSGPAERVARVAFWSQH